MNDQHIKQTNNQTTRGGNNMFQTMKKRIKNEKGLTLIELLAVIVILAIIAAIAIPAIGNIITNSKYNAIKSDAMNILNAGQLAKTDGLVLEGESESATEVTVGALKKEGYLENEGTFKEDAVISLTSPIEIKTATVPFENGVSIVFDGAKVTDIKSDKEKGSDIAKAGVPYTIKK